MSLSDELDSLPMEASWKDNAIWIQMEFFDSLGSRPYDEIDKTDLFQLKKKVGFATCGPPDDLPSANNHYTGYNTENLNDIKKICDQIIQKSEINPVRFACIKLVLHYKNAICEAPVFRIVTKCGLVFIDAQARVYTSWAHFMKDNKLPDCEYCYPVNGEYFGNNKEVEFAFPPASKLFHKTLEHLDTVGSIAALGAVGVSMVAAAPVALAAATATGVCTGAYCLARSVHSLRDRKKHDQSISLKDREARSAWLNIGSSVAFMSLAKAVSSAKKVVDSGKTLSKLSVAGIKALNITSFAFSGFGFVESLVICVDEYNKGTLTKKHVFDLSCEVLFLYGAIASAKATNNLVNSMNATLVENPSIQKKLTKTQKRNLRKRNAKRRAKGLAPKNTSATINPTEKEAKVSDKETSSVLGKHIPRPILKAMSDFDPRLEKILYACQSIGHDIESWKSKEISGPRLLINVSKTTIDLFENFSDEIKEVVDRIAKYFNMEKVYKEFLSQFENATIEKRIIFGTQVIKMEDEIDGVVTEAENDVMAFHDKMGIDVTSNSIDMSDSEELDESDFSPEARKVLSRSIIISSSLPCKELVDFGTVLEEVKNEVVTKFKEKITNYTKFLQAASAVPGESLDIEQFHKSFGIQGDVNQFMFDSTLKELGITSSVCKIMTKLTQNSYQQGKTGMCTAIREEEYAKVFIGFGSHKGGKLTEAQLGSLVKKVLKSYSSNVNFLLEYENVHVISVSGDTKLGDKFVVALESLTSENTAFVKFVIVNNSE